MKTKSIDENEQLLQTIAIRQSELEQLTTRLIHTDSKPEQLETKSEPSYKWFSSRSHVLLSNAV